jgi:hypothetical protein
MNPNANFEKIAFIALLGIAVLALVYARPQAYFFPAHPAALSLSSPSKYRASPPTDALRWGMQQRIAANALAEAGLVKVSSELTDQGKLNVTLNDDNVSGSPLLACIIDGISETGEIHTHLIAVAASILALEIYNRPFVIRAAKDHIVFLTFKSTGHLLPWSLGLGQIKLATFERELLSDTQLQIPGVDELPKSNEEKLKFLTDECFNATAVAALVGREFRKIEPTGDFFDEDKVEEIARAYNGSRKTGTIFDYGELVSRGYELIMKGEERRNELQEQKTEPEKDKDTSDSEKPLAKQDATDAKNSAAENPSSESTDIKETENSSSHKAVLKESTEPTNLPGKADRRNSRKQVQGVLRKNGH